MSKPRWSLLLLLCLAAPASSNSDHEPSENVSRRSRFYVSSRIRNGKEDTEGKFPLVGLLEAKGRSCSATLLSDLPCVVLTAEHCKNTLETFSLGRSKAKVVDHQAVPADAGKKEDGTPDIALVMLDQSFEVPEGVRTTLSSKPLPSESDKTVTIVGLGNSKGNRDLFGKRQIGKMSATYFTRGGGVRLRLAPIPSENNSLCAGDSGGPVFDGNELIGVNSTTEKEFPATACVSPLTGSETIPDKPGTGIDYDKESKLVWSSTYRLDGIRAALAMIHLGTTSPDEINGNTSDSWPVAKLMCQFLGDPKGKTRKKIEANLKAIYKDSYSKAPASEADEYAAEQLKSSENLGAGRTNWRLPLIEEVKKSPASYRYAKGGFWVSNETESSLKHAVYRDGRIRSLQAIPTDCDVTTYSSAASVPHHRKQIDEILTRFRKKGCPKPTLEVPMPTPSDSEI